VREACWHQCPVCKTDWSHAVNGKALVTDRYFLWCKSCVLRHGFDAVEFVMRRKPRARAVEEAEEFQVLLPEQAQEEQF